MKAILKVLMVIVLIAFIGWLGVWAYSCIAKPGEAKVPKPPDAVQVQYSITIKNTGGLYFTSQYPEIRGGTPGQRVYILKDCWQLQGAKYVQIKTPPPLDERVFGIITLEKR